MDLLSKGRVINHILGVIRRTGYQTYFRGYRYLELSEVGRMDLLSEGRVIKHILGVIRRTDYQAYFRGYRFFRAIDGQSVDHRRPELRNL